MLLKIILSLALQLLFTAADSTTTTHNVHNKSTIKTNDQLPLQQHSNKRQRILQVWNQNNYGCNPGHCYVPRYQQWYVSLVYYVHIISPTFSITNAHLSTYTAFI